MVVRRQKISIYDETKKQARKQKRTSIGSSPNSFGNGRNKHKKRMQKRYRGQGR